MNEPDLIEDDYLAAKELIDRHPEWANEKDILCPKFAALHAHLGDSRFRLLCGLRKPRSDIERLKLAFLRREIDEQEGERRFRAVDDRPIDDDAISSLLGALEERLSFYGRALQTVHETVIDRRKRGAWQENERKCDRYVREMSAPLNLPEQQVGRILSYLAECRAERGLRPPVVAEFHASTAFGLVMTVMKCAKQVWSSVSEIAAESQTDRSPYQYATNTSNLFHHTFCTQLALPDELLALIHEEAAIARLSLRNRRAENVAPTVEVTNHVHVQPTPVTLNPQVTVRVVGSALEQPHNRTGNHRRQAIDHPQQSHTASDSGRLQIQLSNWAVGTASGADWTLFHLTNGKWQERRKLAIPKGAATALLLKLAEQQGYLTSEEAVAVLRPGYPGRNNADLVRSVTDALSKIKVAIRQAIADCSKCDIAEIPNPIPNVKPDWRAVIAIGFATTDDNGKLGFTTKDEMKRR